MRASALALLALVPCAAPHGRAPLPPPPPVAIEIQIRAPLRVGVVEWRTTVGRVPAVSIPYDLNYCADEVAAACQGFELRLRVLIGRGDAAAG